MVSVFWNASCALRTGISQCVHQEYSWDRIGISIRRWRYWAGRSASDPCCFSKSESLYVRCLENSGSRDVKATFFDGNEAVTSWIGPKPTRGNLFQQSSRWNLVRQAMAQLITRCGLQASHVCPWARQAGGLERSGVVRCTLTGRSSFVRRASIVLRTYWMILRFYCFHSYCLAALFEIGRQLSSRPYCSMKFYCLSICYNGAGVIILQLKTESMVPYGITRRWAKVVTGCSPGCCWCAS